MPRASGSFPRYIVIEGPIGVGKTTLTRRLARDLGAQTVLEAPDENPFLPRFYREPRANAFSTQLFFLLQRARQLKDLRQLDLFGTARIADFMVEKDAIFAELTLDPDELALYKQVSEQLFVDPVRPDLVIYLQAPVKVLCERIAHRGISYEQTVDTDYLRVLVEAYGEFFASYDQARLLIVDTASIDLVSSDDDYNALLRGLDGLEAGRHYFNPAPW